MILILGKEEQEVSGGQLFMGNLKAAQDYDILMDNNITHIVQLAAELKPIFDKTQFTYKVVSITNEVSENIAKHFDSVY